MPDLNHRARKILHAVVQEYLHSGDAVGSRTITRRHGIDLSPATVRNVMSDLEELGLLMQPHASAGRIPTNQGLRFFIDSLLKVRSLSPKEKEEIRARHGMPPSDLEEFLSRTSRILSDLAQQATIVITPVPERQKLEYMEFVRLRDNEVLAVLVVEGGQVENKLLRLDFPADAAFLERASNYLHVLLGHKTLEEVRLRVVEELGKEKNQVDELASRALRLGRAALSSETVPGVIVSGQAHLLEGSGSDGGVNLSQIRALLSALEEKERIVRLLDRTLEAHGIQVWVGAETPFAEMGDLSIVATPYGPEDRPIGSIAVVGPTRMNYSKVIPLVDFTAELVSDLLEKWR
ncbi:MAG: heat-inducible transcription repressor HrcA [Deltaproteobacteria bacterium]|nr:heat-inducible transcription repressor HrcA [Deltaproteobacteria bacterium]